MKEIHEESKKRRFSFFMYGPYLIIISLIILFLLAISDAIDI